MVQASHTLSAASLRCDGRLVGGRELIAVAAATGGVGGSDDLQVVLRADGDGRLGLCLEGAARRPPLGLGGQTVERGPDKIEAPAHRVLEARDLVTDVRDLTPEVTTRELDRPF